MKDWLFNSREKVPNLKDWLFNSREKVPDLKDWLFNSREKVPDLKDWLFNSLTSRLVPSCVDVPRLITPISTTRPDPLMCVTSS
jgi:hypothetical protein